MKKFVLASCAVLALASAISVRAVTPVGPEYGYVFVSDPFVPRNEPATDGNPTDGSPITDWGGTLFLKSPSSAGGGVNDIDLNNSTVDTSLGDFSLGDPTMQDLTVSSLAWDSSGINAMTISGIVDLSGGESSFTIEAHSIFIQGPDPTDTGNWVAAPDSASTALLIGLAAAGLCGFQYFSRNRPLARARG